MGLIPKYELETQASQSYQPSLARKKELGAFYTPLSVAVVLCNWAIRSMEDVVLEPSFGGCTFLQASIRRIQDLGAPAADHLFGCDIDPNAFDFLRASVTCIRADNFRQCDFLHLDPQILSGARAAAVIGNPPYVSYSRLSAEQRETIHDWEKLHGLRLNRRASLWTYFTFHALNFLAPGGRMAWVLPVSFMTAKYAESLRQHLSKKFRKIAFFTLSERIFLAEGTEERALIILADGFEQAQGVADMTSHCLDTATDLDAAVALWEKASAVSSSGEDAFAQGLLSAQACALLSKLEEEPEVVALGSLAKISIGAVSGDSKYFIKSIADWRTLGIGKTHLSYVVPRSRWVNGISLTSMDSSDHEEGGVACLALNAPADTKSVAVLDFIASYDKDKVASNATFAKREVWFRFLENKVPDAFFVFMTHHGPRMVVNRVGADTTNSLYRMELGEGFKAKAKLIAISLQTTFTQLAAERIGRARGSGALKLEPCEAIALPIALPERPTTEVNTAFNLIDHHMRSGEPDRARQFADQFIFGKQNAFSKVLEQLEDHLKVARQRRIRCGPKRATK